MLRIKSRALCVPEEYSHSTTQLHPQSCLRFGDRVLLHSLHWPWTHDSPSVLTSQVGSYIHAPPKLWFQWGCRVGLEVKEHLLLLQRTWLLFPYGWLTTICKIMISIEQILSKHRASGWRDAQWLSDSWSSRGLEFDSQNSHRVTYNHL